MCVLVVFIIGAEVLCLMDVLAGWRTVGGAVGGGGSEDRTSLRGGAVNL